MDGGSFAILLFCCLIAIPCYFNPSPPITVSTHLVNISSFAQEQLLCSMFAQCPWHSDAGHEKHCRWGCNNHNILSTAKQPSFTHSDPSCYILLLIPIKCSYLQTQAHSNPVNAFRTQLSLYASLYLPYFALHPSKDKSNGFSLHD